MNREWMVGRFGEKANRWKGEKAGYVAKHMWIKKHYGKANRCENNPSCKARNFDWANISGKYLRDVSDYKMLCRRCHRLMYQKNKCRKGHEFTLENTFLNANGWRECRICKKERKNAA